MASKTWAIVLAVFLPLIASAAEVVIAEPEFARIYPPPTAADPIRAARVLALAEQTFPNLSSQLSNADLLKRAVDDPSMRGNLRGRLAEELFKKNFAAQGWEPVRSAIAPQNDFKRWSNGRLEGAQVKVHANTGDYFRSMVVDHKAEWFVVPDDHYDILKREYAIRREGALRGGDQVKAESYARESNRLRKLGYTFNQLEGAVTGSAKHYRSIAMAMQQAGKAASFVAITLGVIEGGIATYEFANGRTDVVSYVGKIAKVGVGGITSWYVGMSAAELAIKAGAAGQAPVAIAIVVGAATYLVVDWAIDGTAKSMSVAKLTDGQLRTIWPENVPWVPLPTGRVSL